MLRQRGWFLVVFEHVSLSSLHGDTMRMNKEVKSLFAREYKRIDPKLLSFVAIFARRTDFPIRSAEKLMSKPPTWCGTPSRWKRSAK
jgi:hypothetical protein